jgi:LysR family glycine cleavage system transcriptional activator
VRRRLPPLKTLPAFEIAADRLSFTEAARELHLTHGAVSRQIKALESHLGVPLFRRRNRRIELTQAGVAFLPGVRQALHVLETSTAEVATSPGAGPVVVSCVATFMMYWLTPRLHAFNAVH